MLSRRAAQENGILARWWRDLSWPDLARLDPASTVVVLPVAATEQHGPHLPVGVDDVVNAGVVAAAMPGALAFTAETLTRLWTEIGESVARAGVREFVMLTSHGGQPQVMDIVARDLRVRLGLFGVAANLSGLNTGRGLFGETEARRGIPGGASETPQMLHLHPELVRVAHAADFAPASIAIEAEYHYLQAEGAAVGFRWQTQHLHPLAAIISSTPGTA